jgi:hypothetical protein
MVSIRNTDAYAHQKHVELEYYFFKDKRFFLSKLRKGVQLISTKKNRNRYHLDTAPLLHRVTPTLVNDTSKTTKKTSTTCTQLTVTHSTQLLELPPMEDEKPRLWEK